MPDHTNKTTTNRLLVIDWSNRADSTNRRNRWGGKINSWNVEKLNDNVYLIPNSVKISDIQTALEKVIRPSDQAVLSYPYGETSSGSSAMRVHIFGKQES
jgi:hypothetical protein